MLENALQDGFPGLLISDGYGVYRGVQAIINTKGGEIKADDLDKFRDEQSESDSSGSDGGTVRQEAIGDAGAVG